MSHQTFSPKHLKDTKNTVKKSQQVKYLYKLNASKLINKKKCVCLYVIIITFKSIL